MRKMANGERDSDSSGRMCRLRDNWWKKWRLEAYRKFNCCRNIYKYSYGIRLAGVPNAMCAAFIFIII